MRKFFLFLSAAFFSFAFSHAAFAEERILNFASSMQVQKDGSVIVEETITVNAENIKIRRGLYRDIPNPETEPVEFISLYMNNEPHPSFTETSGKNLRINFGDDNYIPKGIHTYRLTYSVKNVVKDFPDYDEVYWNVTGNNWDFTIERASFLILLPEDADIKDSLVSLYTGRKGSKGSNAVKTETYFYETTEDLYAGEGFTVAVPFEKGIVKSYKKTFFTSLSALSAKSLMLMAAGLILFVFFFKYIIGTWLAVGRDPKDAIVTEFTPPKGISPAFMRSLWNRGNDRKMFAVALISLAMKNKIEISEEQKTAVLKLKDRSVAGLPEEERYIIDFLFSSKEEFKINQSNWSRISSCIQYIEKNFNLERKKYILSNKKYVLPAALMLVLFQLLLIPFGFIALAFIFVNLHYSIFVLVFVGLVAKNKVLKIIAFILLNLFYSLFFFDLTLKINIYIAVSVAEHYIDSFSARCILSFYCAEIK